MPRTDLSCPDIKAAERICHYSMDTLRFRECAGRRKPCTHRGGPHSCDPTLLNPADHSINLQRQLYACFTWKGESMYHLHQ